jgi:hypothetical protein
MSALTWPPNPESDPMKNLFSVIAIALLPLSGCLAQTEDPTPGPAPEPTCPVVDCGWVDNAETGTQSCGEPNAFASQQRFEELDDGASACWIYDSVCVPRGTRAECVPEACRRTHVTCQPTDRSLGRP